MTHKHKYGQVTIHPHAQEMLHKISNATFIHMNSIVGMYIANEACLLDSIGRTAYLEQCATKFEEAEETLEYFEPSDSNKYKGRVKIYQEYLAKLREIAWSINVHPQDFLCYVISAEYSVFVNLNKELYIAQYMKRLGHYKELMNAMYGRETSTIYFCRNTRASSGFVPANELKKQGGDTLGGDSLL